MLGGMQRQLLRAPQPQWHSRLCRSATRRAPAFVRRCLRVRAACAVAASTHCLGRLVGGHIGQRSVPSRKERSSSLLSGQQQRGRLHRPSRLPLFRCRLRRLLRRLLPPPPPPPPGKRRRNFAALFADGACATQVLANSNFPSNFLHASFRRLTGVGWVWGARCPRFPGSPLPGISVWAKTSVTPAYRPVSSTWRPGTRLTMTAALGGRRESRPSGARWRTS